MSLQSASRLDLAAKKLEDRITEMIELVRRHMAIVEAKMQQNFETSPARVDRAAEQLAEQHAEQNPAETANVNECLM